MSVGASKVGVWPWLWPDPCRAPAPPCQEPSLLFPCVGHHRLKVPMYGTLQAEQVRGGLGEGGSWELLAAELHSWGMGALTQ